MFLPTPMELLCARHNFEKSDRIDRVDASHQFDRSTQKTLLGDFIVASRHGGTLAPPPLFRSWKPSAVFDQTA